jgi:CRISPR-associated protein Cas2
MTVIVCNNTPDCIRGHLKRWFIEPKPNVFVGTVKTKTRDKTLAYIRRNAPDLGMLVISSDRSVQGFNIHTFGDTNRRAVDCSGLHLVAEKWAEDSISDL